MGTLQSLIYVVVMEDFYSTFLNKKKISIWKYVLVWFSYFIYQIVIMRRINSPSGNLLLNFIFLCFVLEMVYVGSSKMKLVTNFLGISLCAFAELLVAIMVMIFQGEIRSDNHLYGILSKVLFWIITRITSAFVKEKMEESRNIIYLFSLGMIATLNIVWNILIFKIDSQIDNKLIHSWTLILAIALLSLDIIGFKIYGMLLERQEMKNINEKYRYQLEVCNKEMEERQVIMDNIRRTKHDMKNQLLYLNELVKRDPQEAENYLEQLVNNDLNKSNEISNSGNLVIDALINNKYLVAIENGIEVRSQIKIPSEIPYEAADLCIVIGNLLDNAIEAAQIVEKTKWVEINIQYKNQSLLINIKNAYNGKILQDKDGNYITQKEDSQNHGWGLRSVHKCVEKYKGTMEIYHDENIFKVDIIM